MLDHQSLDKILRQARTHSGWLAKPVTDDQLRATYEVMKWGPTSSNSQPIRIVFIRTQEGQGEAAAGLEQRQHRQDHGRAGDGDRGLRHPVL